MDKSLIVRTADIAARPGTPTVLPPRDGWQHALPVLTGELSSLRELEPEDAPNLLPLLSAPEVARFISPPPHSLEQFRWFIETSRAERRAGRYAAFALVPNGHQCAVGVVQLRQSERGFVTGEWGFAMGSRWWGSGLFLDASRLLIDFAFNTVGVHRLEARAAAGNARCQAAMQKLGAVREGVLRKSLTAADGSRLDQVLWSLLDEDWRELMAAAAVRVH
jgi:RimJ/RimL family protein N-acetyltransferase